MKQREIGNSFFGSEPFYAASAASTVILPYLAQESRPDYDQN